jgi:tetratricopeptide (TPR) repeat protein
VAVLAAYGNAFHLGAALDGNLLVAGDPRTHAATFDALKTIFTTDYWWPSSTDLLYRPLTTASFLINYAVLDNGPQPAGYHAVNIALHTLNVWLAFALLSRLFQSRWPAFLAAVLWAVHPVGTETVANIAGRADLLTTVGLLGALLLYAEVSGQTAFRWWRYGAIFLLAALAVFAKETGAVLLGLLLLWDLAQRSGAGQGIRSRAPAWVAAAAALGIYWWLRSAVFASLPWPVQAFVDNPLRTAGFWGARWTAVKMLGMDLLLLIFPVRLCSDRSFNQIPIAGLADPWAWAALLTVLSILAVTIVRWRKDPLLFWAAGLCGLTLLPVSNLVVLISATVADRFLYLPSLAFAAAITALIYRFAPPRSAPVILLALAVLYAGRTMARNPDWDSTLALAAHDSPIAPQSARLHDSYGEYLYAADPRNLDRTIDELEKAWAILRPVPPDESNPQIPGALGTYYFLRGNLSPPQSPEARSWYDKSLSVLLRAEEISRAAERVYDESQRSHGKPPAPRRLAQLLYFQLGDTYSALGRYEDAIRAYRYGRGIDPTAPAGYDAIANAYRRHNDPAMAALTALEGALALGATPGGLDAVARSYASLPGGACAVRNQNGAAVLDVGCPRVRSDMCRALAELSQTFTEARQLDRVAAIANIAVGQYACPQSR